MTKHRLFAAERLFNNNKKKRSSVNLNKSCARARSFGDVIGLKLAVD